MRNVKSNSRKDLKLERETRSKIRRFTQNKLNFISGTVAPPPVLTNAKPSVLFSELECLESALKSMQKNGVEDIVIQHKHMGSRATVCLYRDNNLSRVITRNGYILKTGDISPEEAEKKGEEWLLRETKLRDGVKKYLATLHFMMFSRVGMDVDYAILDCELMPWSILAEGLVKRTYGSLVEQYDAEAIKIKSILNRVNVTHSVDSKIKALTDSYTARSFNMDKFKHQVKLFASTDEEVQLIPFEVLLVKEAGKEPVKYHGDLKTQLAKFPDILSGTPYSTHKVSELLETNLNNLPIAKSCEGLELEGLIVRPLVYNPNETSAVPYMKVRNRNYLMLTYGPNYLSDEVYPELCRTKNTKVRERASKDQWAIGDMLLDIPLHTLDINNELYAELVEKAINSFEKSEQYDDSRL